MTLALVVVVAALAVLAFDALACAVALRTGTDYGRFALVSFALWAGAGSAGALLGGPAWWAPLAGATTALVDSTAGWALSAWLGPGDPARRATVPTATEGVPVGGPPNRRLRPREALGVVDLRVSAVMTAIGGALGAAGGLLVTAL